MKLAQDIDIPHAFHTQAAATEVPNYQQRSTDNGWSSPHDFSWDTKILFEKEEHFVNFCTWS
jgi:hypothetical protein